MARLLWGYVKELYAFAGWKLVLDMVLVIILGLFESVSIVMLLPLLAFAGVSPGTQTDGGWMGQMVEQVFHAAGLTVSLPLVLAVFTGVIAAQGWLQRYEGILSTTINESFDRFLSTRLYREMTYADWAFFLSRKKADIGYVVLTELRRVSTGTFFLLRVAGNVLFVTIQVGLAFLLAPYLTLVVLAAGAVLFCFMQRFVKEARRKGALLARMAGAVFAEVNENLNGIKEVKSYGAEQLQVKTYENHRCKVEQVYIDFAKVQSKAGLYYKLGAALFISVFYYTAVQVFQVNAQNLILLVVIFSRLWPQFSTFQGNLQSIAMLLPAFVAVNDLRQQCATEREPLIGMINSPLRLVSGIRLAKVSFRYDTSQERYAVRQLTSFIPSGRTTAIVGVSGSGKSTLADLVLGLIRPEQGEVLIDGVGLKGDNMYTWRRSIGYVPQDAFLFNASIRDNLSWACPGASDREIWEALEQAAIASFVRGLPEKLETVVGDRGIRLSGGERQRLVLARALLRKPTLLVLDEATSSLDTENEKRIQQAIDGLRGQLTILIIAHRLSTIKNADQILVLEKGRLVEQGSYQSFLADHSSRFYQLACL
ncbi:MAG: transporter related [Firmicutes bacterium]|nr:transporter related [Bacillota bacterium]